MKIGMEYFTLDCAQTSTKHTISDECMCLIRVTFFKISDPRGQ